MSSIARGLRLSDEPKCSACRHWKVVHRGKFHVGDCSAFDCVCPKFAYSGPVSSQPEAGPVAADSPAAHQPIPSPRAPSPASDVTASRSFADVTTSDRDDPATVRK